MGKKKMEKERRKLWDRYRISKSRILRDQLFNIYYPHSKAVAKNYIKNHKNSNKYMRLYENDCFTWAAQGLVQAIERYDPQKNNNFKLYSNRRIYGNIIDALRSVGHKLRGKYNINEISISLFEEKIKEQNGEGVSTDFLEAPEPDYDKIDIEDWLITLSKNTVLDKDQIIIVKLRYVDNFTYEEIGNIVGLSESMISQKMVHQILPVLKEYYIQNPSAIMT